MAVLEDEVVGHLNPSVNRASSLHQHPATATRRILKFLRHADVRFGSKADIHPPSADVRFTPESRHWSAQFRCPLCAKSGREQAQQSTGYSITSSARASRVGGMVNSSALAVVRLINSSNFVGNSIG